MHLIVLASKGKAGWIAYLGFKTERVHKLLGGSRCHLPSEYAAHALEFQTRHAEVFRT